MATANIVLKTKLFTAMLIRNFIFQGCIKSFGVIIADTVNHVNASLPVVALSFTILEGLNFLSGLEFLSGENQ